MNVLQPKATNTVFVSFLTLVTFPLFVVFFHVTSFYSTLWILTSPVSFLHDTYPFPKGSFYITLFYYSYKPSRSTSFIGFAIFSL